MKLLICHRPREGPHHNAVIQPCLHKCFQNDNTAAAEHFVPPPEQMLCREEGGGKKGTHKSKAQVKRLIIFQQEQTRMVGLHLYTLPFVSAHSYYSSINGDIKKALVNSTGKLSLGEGPAQTGRAGLGFAARGLGSLHCVYVAGLGFGLSLCLTLKSHKLCKTVKAECPLKGLCPYTNPGTKRSPN